MDKINNATLKINGNTLKIIAVITMIIDHIGGVLIEGGILHWFDSGVFQKMLLTDYGMKWYDFDFILRCIGRISFPIFCFLLVEGFLHTRNLKKYLSRILIFAFISEIPFDLALYNRFFAFDTQNVLFTFFIGILMMMVLSRFKGRYIFQVLTVLISGVVAYMLKTDYTFIGILIIAVLYLFREDRSSLYFITGIVCMFESYGFYFFSVFSLPIIAMYNGQKGRLNLKYLFYLFYPIHLIILVFIRVYFMGVPIN